MPPSAAVTPVVLERLAATGGPTQDLVDELPTCLDACLGVDSVIVHWYDATSQMVDFYTDRAWPAAAIRGYLADYQAAARRYTSSAASRLAANTVYAYRGQDIATRPVYQDVVAPLGLSSFLNIPLQTPDGAAIITCSRAGGASARRGFNPTEISLARQMSGTLQRLLGTPPDANESSDRVEESGTLMLGEAGDVLAACAAGHRFLALLGAMPQFAAAGTLQARFRHLIDIACENRAGDHTWPTSDRSAATSISTHWGRFRLAARKLTSLPAAGSCAPIFAIRIEQHRGVAAEIANIANRHALSRRETEVLAGLRQGLGYANIAGQLGVSVTSIKTFARSLYRKLEVTDRTELLTRTAN